MSPSMFSSRERDGIDSFFSKKIKKVRRETRDERRETRENKNASEKKKALLTLLYKNAGSRLTEKFGLVWLFVLCRFNILFL